MHALAARVLLAIVAVHAVVDLIHHRKRRAATVGQTEALALTQLVLMSHEELGQVGLGAAQRHQVLMIQAVREVQRDEVVLMQELIAASKDPVADEVEVRSHRHKARDLRRRVPFDRRLAIEQGADHAGQRPLVTVLARRQTQALGEGGPTLWICGRAAGSSLRLLARRLRNSSLKRQTTRSCCVVARIAAQRHAGLCRKQALQEARHGRAPRQKQVRAREVIECSRPLGRQARGIAAFGGLGGAMPGTARPARRSALADRRTKRRIGDAGRAVKTDLETQSRGCPAQGGGEAAAAAKPGPVAMLQSDGKETSEVC